MNCTDPLYISSNSNKTIIEYFINSLLRPLKNTPFCTIPASDSNFNPRNTQCMTACPVGPADRTGVVKIIVFSRSKSGIFDLALNKIEHFKRSLSFIDLIVFCFIMKYLHIGIMGHIMNLIFLNLLLIIFFHKYFFVTRKFRM
jgi:hypothetical protein